MQCAKDYTNMGRYFTLQNILRTLGVIIFGALGSGLWELSKPLLGSAVNGVLTVATLGMGSLRDGIYTAASGSVASTAILVPKFAAVIGLISIYVYFYIAHVMEPPTNNLRRP
jgi:hypothetical protein